MLIMEYVQVILDQKQPRKLFVQPCLVLDDTAGVLYKEYDPSADGMVRSVCRKFLYSA